MYAYHTSHLSNDTIGTRFSGFGHLSEGKMTTAVPCGATQQKDGAQQHPTRNVGVASEQIIRRLPARSTESTRVDGKSGGRFVSVKEERVQRDVREDCHFNTCFCEWNFASA